jgi:hypothetical protein
MSENETPKKPEVEVKAELTLTKEDLVKIKYAAQEKALDEKEDGLAKELKSEREKLRKAEAAFEKVLAAGTDELPEEFAPLAAALTALGNETDGGSARSLHKLKPESTVKLTDETELEGDEDNKGPYYVSERRMIAWRPPLKEDGHERPQYIEAYHDTIRRALTDNEQRALDTVVELEERIKDLDEQLLATKKLIGKLPKMMRQAEAAVAQRVLEQTAEGKMMLEAMDGVKNLLEE